MKKTQRREQNKVKQRRTIVRKIQKGKRHPNPQRGVAAAYFENNMDAILATALWTAFRMAFPGLGRKVFGAIKPGSTLKVVEIECACGGNCLCHTGLQIAGVPCPPDCSNYGKHLDGCHRCFCASGNDLTRADAKDDSDPAKVLLDFLCLDGCEHKFTKEVRFATSEEFLEDAKAAVCPKCGASNPVFKAHGPVQ